MGDDGHPDSDRSAVLDRDQVWLRRIENGVVADPDVFPDLNSPRAMQRNAEALRPGENPGQVLKQAVFKTPEGAFLHIRLPGEDALKIRPERLKRIQFG